MKAISSRYSTASGKVQHSAKACVIRSTQSAKRLFPSSSPRMWSAATRIGFKRVDAEAAIVQPVQHPPRDFHLFPHLQQHLRRRNVGPPCPLLSVYSCNASFRSFAMPM